MAFLDFSKKWTLIMGAGDEVSRFAALELRDIIFKISKEMPLIAERDTGTRSETIFLMHDGGDRDGFTWRASDSRIEFWGDSSRGLLNAVYDFLQEIGCRWLFPGIMGEMLPPSSQVEAKSEGHREIPAFSLRALAISHSLHFTQDWILWASRNGFNSVLFVTGGAEDHCTAIPESRYEAYRYLIVSLAKRCGMRVEHCARQSTTEVDGTEASFGELFSTHPEVDSFHLWAPKGADLAKFASHCAEAAKTLNVVKPMAKLVIRLPIGVDPASFELPLGTLLLSPEPVLAAQAWITERFDTNIHGFAPPPAFDETRAEVENARNAGIKDVYLMVAGNRPWIALQPFPWLFSRFIRRSPADTEALLLDFLDKAYGPAAIALKCYYRYLDEAFNADFTNEKSDFKPFINAEESLERAQNALSLYEAENSANVVNHFFEDSTVTQADYGQTRPDFYDLPFCRIHFGLLRAEHELTEAVIEFEAIRKTVACLDRATTAPMMYRIYSLAALVAAGKMRKWANRYLSDARTKKAFLHFLFTEYVGYARSIRSETYVTGVLRSVFRLRHSVALGIRTRGVRNLFNP